eukprot:SAG25_NODE_329_length_9697_cov_22.376120_6_plen_241_part_00
MPRPLSHGASRDVALGVRWRGDCNAITVPANQRGDADAATPAMGGDASCSRPGDDDGGAAEHRHSSHGGETPRPCAGGGGAAPPPECPCAQRGSPRPCWHPPCSLKSRALLRWRLYAGAHHKCHHLPVDEARGLLRAPRAADDLSCGLVAQVNGAAVLRAYGAQLGDGPGVIGIVPRGPAEEGGEEREQAEVEVTAAEGAPEEELERPPRQWREAYKDTNRKAWKDNVSKEVGAILITVV